MAILHYPTTDPARLAEDSRERLNVAWIEAVRSHAPHLGALRDYLSSRLTDAGKAHQADSGRLLRIVDDAMERARPSCAPHTADALSRRLRQAVYEHLLEVDAIRSMEFSAPEPPPPFLTAPGPVAAVVAAPPPETPAPWVPAPSPPTPAQLPAAPPAQLPTAPPVSEAPVTVPVAAAPVEGWSVRDRTPAGHRQAPPAVNSELADARRRIGEWLRHKRFAEAAAQVQRICAESGGQEAVDLALDTGERCRGKGKKMAATSCYIAALRADPTNELALLQLAEMCIDDSDIDLAVSHLERIAQLATLRNDEDMALRMYRRIVTIAPQRDDILGLLMHTQMSIQDRNLHPRR